MPVTERWKRVSSELVLKGQGSSVTSHVGLGGSAFVPESEPIVGEIVGTGYARIPVTWTDFVADMTNLGTLAWSTGSAWPGVEYVFVSDSSQGGGALMYASLASILVTDGDVISIATGDLILT